MSNDWSIIGPSTVRYQNIDETSTTQNHPLGYRVHAVHATYGVAEFVYCAGVASTIATDWVTIGSDFATTRLVADAVGPVGIAMSACVASNWGWYCIYGKVPGGSAGAIVNNTQIYISGTATVDDAVTDGDMVHGAICRSTISGASITGLFQLYYPYTDNINSND